MRNRQWISAWCFEQGKGEVIKKVKRNGATYYDIADYERLRGLFGDLLREVQRIKSKGDYEAARALVEDYGVKVDPEFHNEVLTRAKKVKTAPYAGFIQPELVPTTSPDGEILDVTVHYPTDLIQQMLMYGEKYSFLPDEN